MAIEKKDDIQGSWRSNQVQYERYMNTTIPFDRNSYNYSFLRRHFEVGDIQKSAWYTQIKRQKANRSFNYQNESINRDLPKERNGYNENSYISDRLSREFGANKDESKDKKQIVFIHNGMSPNHILVNDKNNEKDIIVVGDNDYDTVILDTIKAQNGDIDVKFLQHGQKGTSRGDITRDDISMSNVIDVSIEQARKYESCKNITISNVQCYGNIKAVWNNLTSKIEDLQSLNGKKFVIRIGDDKYPGWADSNNRSNFIKGASGSIYRRNMLEIDIDDDGKPTVRLNHVNVTKDFLNKCSFEELRENHKNYESKDGIGSEIDPLRIKFADEKYDDEYIAYILSKLPKNDIEKTVQKIRSKSHLLSDKAKKIIFSKDMEDEFGLKKSIKQLSHRSFESLISSRRSRSGRLFE